MVTWQRWYDYNNMDSEASDGVQTFDGGYMILTNNFEFNNYSILLIKLDYLGNIEWQKLINNTLIGFGLSCFSLSQAPDSGYVVSGYGSKAVLLKTDSKGNILWIRQYISSGYGISRFFDHKITSDYGIIAIGDLYTPFMGYIVKTNSNGIVQWDSIYNLNLTKSSIIESKLDKNYYVTGGNMISKIDHVGRLIWTSGYSHIGEAILQNEAGEIFCGEGYDDFYLTKFDTSGNFIWQKMYDPLANFSAFCFTKDRNILMTGFKDDSIFTFQTNIEAVKVDTKGNQIFSKTISSFAGRYFALSRSVNSTKDSGFIFSGITDYPHVAQLRNNAFSLKSDSTCNAPVFVGINEESIKTIESFTLKQNYPNPFNASTILSYSINSSGNVILDLFDNNGKKIINILNKNQTVGNYEVMLNSEGLTSGIYFVKMSFFKNESNFNQSPVIVRKIVLLK